MGEKIKHLTDCVRTVQEVNQNISHVQQHVQKGFGYIDEGEIEIAPWRLVMTKSSLFVSRTRGTRA